MSSSLVTTHLDELEGGVLYLLVRVIKMEIEEVKDLRLVHLTPADLVVLQLVSVKTQLNKLNYTKNKENLFEIWPFNCFLRLLGSQTSNTDIAG